MFFLENIKQTNPFEGRKISDSNNIVFFDMIFQAFFNCWHLQSPRLEVILDMLTQSQRCSYWGGASPTPPGIWQISSPYSNQGADYAQHITACPPGFENLTTSLISTVF